MAMQALTRQLTSTSTIKLNNKVLTVNSTVSVSSPTDIDIPLGGGGGLALEGAVGKLLHGERDVEAEAVVRRPEVQRPQQRALAVLRGR
eukprot:6984904-Pyramimonas_sp.AAC.1